MSQASADAEAVYRDLLDSAKTVVPTRKTVQALGLHDLVKADPPLLEGKANHPHPRPALGRSSPPAGGRVIA